MLGEQRIKQIKCWSKYHICCWLFSCRLLPALQYENCPQLSNGEDKWLFPLIVAYSTKIVACPSDNFRTVGKSWVEIVICLRHLRVGDNFRTVGQVAGDNFPTVGKLSLVLAHAHATRQNDYHVILFFFLELHCWSIIFCFLGW